MIIKSEIFPVFKLAEQPALVVQKKKKKGIPLIVR